jgi:membrane associated rhomboid family serine protease
VHSDPVLVTKVLVGLNVGLFALQQVSDQMIVRGSLVGAPIALDGQWYRLISSAFLHVSLTHVLFNMLALWFVGAALEPRLGRARYLTVYLVSALAGSVLSYAVDPVGSVSVGASGAVFGLFGALFVLAVRLRIDVRGVLAIIVINVVIGFVPGLNINWRAHLGGLIAGTILTAAMVYAPKAQRVAAAATATVVILLVCVGVTVWRTDVIRSCVDGQRSVSQCSSLFASEEVRRA